MNLEKLKTQLILHEGREPYPYLDSVGKWTGGVGRNMSDVPFSDDEIMLMLENDIYKAIEAVDYLVSRDVATDDVRWRVLVDMAFNLGQTRLSKFKKLLAAVEQKDWSQAALEMENSDWHSQVGKRAERLEKMMRTGEDDPLLSKQEETRV